MSLADEEPFKLFDVPQIVSENLKDLDIALGQMGEVLATILGLIKELESSPVQGEREVLAILGKKLEQSWELYLLLEETIEAFPAIHRAIYYGPFRDSVWSKVPVVETPRGKAFAARTTSVFESFLVHCESVLDHLFRTVSQPRHNPPPWILNLQSMGELISLHGREPEKFNSSEGSLSFAAIESITEHFDALDDVRAYRNFVVHHGSIPLRSTVVRTPSGYLDGRVTGSRVRRVAAREWKISDDELGWLGGFDVALFSRYALWRVLTVCEVALTRLLGKVPGKFPR